MEIPLGSRFQPCDYHMLKFLFNFVTGRSCVGDEALIHQEDVFGEKEPWELIPPGKKMAYFFTRLKKMAKSKKGSRVQRTVGKKVKGKKPGNWHGHDIGKAVADESGRFLIGYKRSFVYKNKSEPEQEGKWLLKEFYLSETMIRRVRAEFPIVEGREDFVLCRIERKKKDDDDDDDNDEEDDEMTSEQGGGTNSNVSEAVSVPVETPILQITDGNADDDIDSYFAGVPVDSLLAPANNMNSCDINVDVPMETIAEGGDDDDIDSFFDGIPIETIGEGVPMETLLAAPAGDTEGGSYISSGVPTSPELGLEFMDFNEIWNTEDVSRLIDFDS